MGSKAPTSPPKPAGEPEMIQLGDRVKDIITGYTGIVTGRGDFLYGCVRFIVADEKLDDKGKVHEGHWFDEGQLKIVDVGVIRRPETILRLPVPAPAQAVARTGGPRSSEASRSADPVR